jgi:hypothetical protein
MDMSATTEPHDMAVKVGSLGYLQSHRRHQDSSLSQARVVLCGGLQVQVGVRFVLPPSIPLPQNIQRK